MYFNHVDSPNIKRPFVKRLDRNDGHYYETESGQIYPSITTVLRSLTNDGITKWRNAVGGEVADRISKESTDVGNTLHELINTYLKNEYTFEMEFDPHGHAIEPFLLLHAMKPYLTSIDNIHALEKELYSDKMKIAGTVDCIAEYDNILSIIDFKNSRKPKTKSRVKSYLLQITAYREMWKELLGINIEQGIIIIGNWDSTSTLFKFNPDDYVNELWEVLINYEKMLK